MKAIYYTDGSMWSYKGKPHGLSGFLRFLKDENNQTVWITGFIKFSAWESVNLYESEALQRAIAFAHMSESVPAEIHSDSQAAIELVKSSMCISDNVTIHKVAGHSGIFGNEAIDKILNLIKFHSKKRSGVFTLEDVFQIKANLHLAEFHPLPALKELHNRLKKEGKDEYTKQPGDVRPVRSILW